MTKSPPSLRASRACLDQALDLLDRLDDDQYARGRGDWSAVGAQYRHVVEHFQCLLEGAARGRVDYDARRRDPAVEVSREHARSLTLELRSQLDQIGGLPLEHPIAIQLQSHPDVTEGDWSGSTFGRELQFLVSHTVHHFALIKLLLAPDGLDLPTDFGTAPSTLVHARSRT